MFFMSNEVLEKVKLLSPDEQKAVENFILGLLSQHKETEADTEESVAEMRLRNMGRLKGQIWMADDFNDTPEDFKDYL